VLLTLDLMAAMFCFLAAPLFLIMIESFRPQIYSEAQPALSEALPARS
jgi:hypothetical protein